MDSLKNAWGQGHAVEHIRSLSNLRSSSSPKEKASTNSLRSSYGTSHAPTATVAACQELEEEMDAGTITDPRTPHPTPSRGSGTETPRHPDLSDEVANLSQKLVHAINLQTTLDDTLSETRHELEIARARIQEVEGIVASQRETLEGHVWIRRSSVEPEKELLRQRIKDLKKEKAVAEAETTQMRDELERYSTQVMTEAQKMVVTAKTEFQEKEEQMQQKIDQLRGQASDYEEMFKAQQEQLVELRQAMESQKDQRDQKDQKDQTAEMRHAMDDVADQPEDRSSCCPSSPDIARNSVRGDDTPSSDNASNGEVSAPVAPLRMTHLIQPALRDDVCVFAEFAELVDMAKASKTNNNNSHVRVSSGAYSGFASLAMGLGGNPYVLSQENSSTSSLPASSTATDSNPHTPNTPASTVSASSAASARPTQPLQSTKFFKRIVDEDIEPTIRRSTSVINWVTKRNFSAACADGTLIIEPVLVDTPIAKLTKPQYDPCSICGEDSDAKEQLRMHKFGIGSEARNALCNYCLGRVRTSCELVTFLRMVREGLWKVEGENGLRAAWEECTRLREEIFWARIGGGVVPAQEHRHGRVGNQRDSTPVPQEARVPALEALELEALELEALEAREKPDIFDEGDPIASMQSLTTTTTTMDIQSQSIEDDKPSGLPAILRQRSDSAMNARPTTPSRTQSALKRLSLTIPTRAGFFS